MLALVAAIAVAAPTPGPDRGDAAAPAVDNPGADGARAATTVYVATGSQFRYQIVRAPLPTAGLGPAVLAGVDAVAAADVPRASARATVAAPLPSVLGEPDPDLPGAAWPHALPAASPVGAAPFAAREGADGRCRCDTVLGDTERERIAALYATHVFTVGAEDGEADTIGDVRLLELRVRYRDGLVVYLNGHEVARRNISPDADAMDIAKRPHGPEWENFYIPARPGLLVAGENTLAIEVRPSGHRLAPTLDVELSAAAEARIVRGPMVQNVAASSAVIAFETDLPTHAAVEYGSTSARGRVASSAEGALATRHRVTLDQLAPGGPVHYRVVAGKGASPALAFHTAPGAGQVLRFVVYGDVRGGHDTHGQIVSSIIDEAADLVLFTGDMVLRGSDEGDWQRFFAVAQPLLARVPFYPVAGNHDLGRAGDERRRMNEIFSLWPGPPDRPAWGHWYSFDVGDVHFVVLDSNAYTHAEQLGWLERDLAGARAGGARAIFAVTHDGPFSRGLHRGNRYAAERYVPLLASYGVTLLFSGHDHLYQRGRADGLAYIVSGGGGAPLYSVRCGVSGRPRCRARDGMKHVVSEHHYVLVTVYGRHVEACPKRPDGTALEACTSYRLGARGD